MTKAAKTRLRERLLDQCAPEELAAWFDPLHITEGQNEPGLVVRFPHPLFAAWFAARGKDRFEEAARACFGPRAVAYAAPARQTENKAGPRGTRPTGPDRSGEVVKARVDLEDERTFENFLCSKKNTFPFLCAQDICRAHAKRSIVPDKATPFLLWGESGAGKTHLLAAMAREHTRTRGLTAGVWDGARLRTLLRTRPEGQPDLDALMDELAIVDFLALDNADALFEDVSAQDALCALLDRRWSKQTALACPRPPEKYPDLEERLMERLEQGLTVQLHAPDLDARMRYIRSLERERLLRLTRDQAFILASRFTRFRQLAGIMNRLSAFARHQEKTGEQTAEPEQNISQHDFEDLIQHDVLQNQARITSSSIIEVTANHLALSPADIIGGKRTQPVAQARQMAMLLCRELLHCSYPELGRIFGGKDHSTVMYSIKKIKRLLEHSKDAHTMYATLAKKCQERE